ncbi:MAG: HU family DNA-binding protein [Longimonas sp.]|uniref:HU family DNA-binding protein n=1 Tax=Longimonas sp. TaxID=2039626 RepID=UPI003975BA69
MARPSPKDVLKAFCAVVQDELAAGRDVNLPGLGTIQVEHASSTVQQSDDAAMWSPPKRTITFTPHDSPSTS